MSSKAMREANRRRLTTAMVGAPVIASLALMVVAMVTGVAVRPVVAAPLLTAASFSTPPIAVGASHTCVLPGDGTVLCWGDNTLGQTGSGRVTDPSAPAGDVFVQQVVVADAAGASGVDCIDVTPDGAVIRCHGSASLTGVTAIAAGSSHTCALLEDGTVACWGSNAPIDGGDFSPSLSGGELGDGTLVARPVPALVIAGPGQEGPLTGVRALSAAAGYTCALLEDATAKCWGNAPQAISAAPVTVMADASTPLAQIAAISAGDRNACAVLVDGTVRCWGEGLLGDQRSDTPRDGRFPVEVTEAGDARPALAGIEALALGHGVFNGPNGFALGHSCALTASAEVRCWGVNDVSQLGNGFNAVTGGFDSERDYAVPVIAAPGSPDHLQGVTAIAAGGYFTCALTSGTVKCWGLGFGGDSFEGAGAPVPLEIAATASGGGQVVLAGFRSGSVQTAAAPITDVVAIAAGAGGVCTVLADASLWCSDADNGMTAAPGVAVAAPTPTPPPTSSPTSAPLPTSVPAGSAGPEAVIGDWDNGRVRITYAGGVYSVTNVADWTIPGSQCHIPAGQVIETFSGTGGQYRGAELGWNLTTCASDSAPTSLTLDGDRLTTVHENTGATSVWIRSSAAPLQAEPMSFRNSIPAPWEINLSPAVVLQTLAVAGGLIILVPFPGALFNSTLEGNYAEIMGRLRRARRRARDLVLGPWYALRRRLGRVPASTATPDASTDASIVAHGAETEASAGEPSEPPRDFWWTSYGVGLFILLTVLLSGFLDPSFWFNVPSIATFAGMLIGLVVLLAAFDLPLAAYYRRHHIGFWLHALPATVAVSIACVVISRLTDFHPGYLYGLIIATATARKVDKATEGKLMAAGVAASITAAVIAWFGLGAVRQIAVGTDPGPLLITVETALSMVVVAGIELAAVGMLPITFLVGKSVFEWNRLVWGGMFGFGLIAFGIVILNPQNGYLSDTGHTPIYTVAALLAFFGAGSILFWFYFHRRRSASRADAHSGTP